MLDTIERPSTDKVTEPAKRWRNKYWHSGVLPWRNGADPAGLNWGGPHPSEDVARTKAERFMQRYAYHFRNVGVTVEYLGAFPVTE